MVNNGEIVEKLRGELWERRAVDGKLKSSLEWPYTDNIGTLTTNYNTINIVIVELVHLFTSAAFV